MDGSRRNTSNQHIDDYLDYYLTRDEPPRYAVMLNGAWGVGKTYLLRSFLKDREISSEQYTYVSLYGLTSTTEIDDRIFTDTHKFLDSAPAKLVESIGRSALSYVSVETDLSRKLFFKKFKKDIYIFDDLERCEIPINNVLGYINEFVEHKDKKVLIIANEKEIKKPESYQRIREKLVGKTLAVQPSLQDAFTQFISKLKSVSLQELLAQHANTIQQLYNQHNLNNLRTLQQSIWDFERFFSLLDEKHRSHPDAMLACINLILPLAFAFKAGELQEEDIAQRPGHVPSFARNHSKNLEDLSPFERLELRYPNVDIRDSLLTNEDLANMLVKGVFRAPNIRLSLDSSRYFANNENESALDTLLNAFARSEEQFHKALSAFSFQYQQRAFIETDDLLMTFRLRLWLSSQQLIQEDTKQVLEEGKKYIDDLYADGKLNTLTHEHLEGRNYNIFNNLRSLINGEKSEECEVFFEHLVEKNNAIIQSSYPVIIDSLLADMQNAPDTYARKISYASVKSGEHVFTHVLLLIEPEIFVRKLLGLPPAQQQKVLLAFDSRYRFTPIDINQERPWLKAVKLILQKEAADSQTLFNKKRIASLVEYYIEPHLRNF
ncbi:P-loop NTPase fold protein [Pseudomonas chlororaphis]|uniref:P-loop NTPase fold protein n=1 Tax=Pseudomonas chlororaphis TaxID=587753 RepID=UPI0015DFD3B7|nr:P-loop NTPase fold protein [Pseudomonas chlororaphis]QLL11147.1 hypothetical protein H0I86_19060 [Pseudomonas chlororaphis subsp. aurantiaca]